MLAENTILRRALDTLRDRLPPGWTVELLGPPSGAAEGRTDGLVRLVASDGRAGELGVEVKQRLDPRRATDLAATVPAREDDRPTLAIAP